MYSGSDLASRSRSRSTEQFFGTRVEGHQLLAAVVPFGDHDGGVTHLGTPQQRVLDLTDLDAETADLDLTVSTTEELELSVGQPSTVVPGLVEPIALGMGIRQEGQPGAVRIVDVTAADADAGEHDRPGSTERYRRQMLVHDVDPDVVHRAPEGDAVALGGTHHDLVVGVVGRLGQPIGVDQLDVWRSDEPTLRQLLLQCLPGHRNTAQIRQATRMLLQIREHDLQVGRDQLHHRHSASGDGLDEAFDVQDHGLLDQERPGAHQKPGDQLPQRDVEALRRRLCDDLTFTDLQVVDLGIQVIQHARVFAHRTLWFAGRSRGEVDVRKLIGGDGDARGSRPPGSSREPHPR